MTIRLVLMLVVGLATTGCARRDPPTLPTEADPAVAQAVIAPLLSDPDLVSLDKRFAVMSDPGPLDASLPPDDFAASTIAAARAEAQAMTGDTVPGALAPGEGCEVCDAAFLAERAALLDPDCPGALKDDLAWALRLPDDVPVYPKAHLREAVGSEDDRCPLVGASFTAPVPAAQVLTFYRAVAARAGYAPRAAGGAGFVGTRGRSRMAVLARPLPGGLTHFDLLVAD